MQSSQRTSQVSVTGCRGNEALFVTQTCDVRCDDCNAIDCLERGVKYVLRPCSSSEGLRFTFGSTGSPDINAKYNTFTRRFTNVIVSGTSEAEVISNYPAIYACDIK